jgi:hypothetical protein
MIWLFCQQTPELCNSEIDDQDFDSTIEDILRASQNEPQISLIAYSLLDETICFQDYEKDVVGRL